MNDGEESASAEPQAQEVDGHLHTKGLSDLKMSE